MAVSDVILLTTFKKYLNSYQSYSELFSVQVTWPENVTLDQGQARDSKGDVEGFLMVLSHSASCTFVLTLLLFVIIFNFSFLCPPLSRTPRAVHPFLWLPWLLGCSTSWSLTERVAAQFCVSWRMACSQSLVHSSNGLQPRFLITWLK